MRSTLQAFLILATGLFPLGALAEDQSSTVLNTSLISVIQTLKPTPVTALAGKTYSDTKQGFTLTLPSNWKKGKPDEKNMVFTAQRKGSILGQWFMTKDRLTKKQASDTKKLLGSPKAFGSETVKTLQQQFPAGDCTLDSSGKKTINQFKGAKIAVSCTTEGTRLTVQIFGFLQKTTYYSFVSIAVKEKFKDVKDEMDAISKSVTLTK